MAEETIDKLYGKYGVYEIVKERKAFSTDYYIYKNGKYWKSAIDPKHAYEKIKEYDPEVEKKYKDNC